MARQLIPGRWNGSGEAEPICCSGECNQGRECPMQRRSDPPRESIALRIFDAACWLAAAVVLVFVIYSIDVLDYLMQPHP